MRVPVWTERKKTFFLLCHIVVLTVMLIMCWLFLNEGLAAALSTTALRLLKYHIGVQCAMCCLGMVPQLQM